MEIKQYNTPNNPREYYVVNADGKKMTGLTMDLKASEEWLATLKREQRGG